MGTGASAIKLKESIDDDFALGPEYQENVKNAAVDLFRRNPSGFKEIAEAVSRAIKEDAATPSPQDLQLVADAILQMQEASSILVAKSLRDLEARLLVPAIASAAQSLVKYEGHSSGSIDAYRRIHSNMEQALATCEGVRSSLEARFDSVRNHMLKDVRLSVMDAIDKYQAAFDALDRLKLAEVVALCQKHVSFVPVVQDIPDGVDPTSIEYFVTLYNQRTSVEPMLASVVADLGQQTGVQVHMGRTKSVERCLQKTAEENNSNYSLLGDIIRASLETADLDEVVKVLQCVFAHPSIQVVRVKCRFDPAFDARTNSGNYRDILINCRLGDARHICEIQVHLSDFLSIKKFGGHAAYNVARSLHAFDNNLSSYFGDWNDEVGHKIERGLVTHLFMDSDPTLRTDVAQRNKLAECLSNPACAVSTIRLLQCNVDTNNFATIVSALSASNRKGLRSLTVGGQCGGTDERSNLTEVNWESLQAFEGLKVLDVMNNLITGPVPTTSLMCLAGTLTQLKLSANSMVGQLPTELGLLSHLSDLWVEQMGLTGTIPTEYGQLTHLKFLAIDTNRLTGTVPQELSQCDQLEKFWANCNHLEPPLPQWLFEKKMQSVLIFEENDKLTLSAVGEDNVAQMKENVRSVDDRHLHHECATSHKSRMWETYEHK
eukprot:INCI15934.1.p1 GENE.INCI15934.1~~INCI15934.1.p1  ORF type:complete len:660 (-),score=119.87 INCI15934.1:354-2333(-)